MKRPELITIAGAGLVGSLLGVMLGKRGYRVQIFERRADMRGQEVAAGRSINLALAERGIHALKKAGLMDAVKPLLIPMRGRMLHDRSGNLEFQSYGQRPHEVIYSVSRGGLNELMLTAAEDSKQVEIRFEHELDSIDFENQTIHFTDAVNRESVVVPTQMLIGADGAGSRVRRSLLPFVKGLDRSELLDHDYKELTIPPASNGQHQIDRESLHIWPRGGYMLIALPNLDGSFTVTLFLKKEGDPSFAQLDSHQAVNAFFKTQFADAMELIPGLADEFFENPQGVLGTVRCDPWIDNENVMLIGDASHAIVPFHGQGMNSGFEDCELFICLLEQFGDDWPKAMQAFGRTRPRDADAIADMALENYITMRDSVLDPTFALKKKLGFELELEFPRRFIPRYSMVMFHRVPYAEAKRRGVVQQEILDELLLGLDSLDQVDRARAGELVRERLDLLNESLLAESLLA
ncbi:MAG: FAD-dependent monooxygenase [Mariniblastus sp.]|nr:FAD-dependent monooxygenase [Mariniblastus sp.]